jgi:hypothetical protein
LPPQRNQAPPHPQPLSPRSGGEGREAICSLLHVQKLASAGKARRGKKVVVSYTAETFVEHATVKQAWYDGNFSPVHAGELVGHDLFVRANKRRQLWGEGPWWRAAGVLVTFHAVCFGFLLFSGRLTAVPATPSGTVAALAGFKPPR